jgi:hypothetical protein
MLEAVDFKNKVEEKKKIILQSPIYVQLLAENPELNTMVNSICKINAIIDVLTDVLIDNPNENTFNECKNLIPTFSKLYRDLYKQSGIDTYINKLTKKEPSFVSYRLVEDKLAFILTDFKNKELISEQVAVDIFTTWQTEVKALTSLPLSKPK